MKIKTFLIAVIVTFASLAIIISANADDKDEFPGRRQGGGTHYIEGADQ
jgi:hypothetical protein